MIVTFASLADCLHIAQEQWLAVMSIWEELLAHSELVSYDWAGNPTVASLAAKVKNQTHGDNNNMTYLLALLAQHLAGACVQPKHLNASQHS